MRGILERRIWRRNEAREYVLGRFLVLEREDGGFVLEEGRTEREIACPGLWRWGLFWGVCGGVLRLAEGDHYRFRCRRFLLMTGFEVLCPFVESILDLS